MDDREYVLAAQRGERSAFDALVDLHQEPITHFIYRFFSNVDDMQGMVQEVFIKAFRNLKQFDPSIGEFRSWLFKIAYNTSISEIQNRKRRTLNNQHEILIELESRRTIDNPDKEFVQFSAPEEPGIISVGAIVTQDERECLAECIITVTKELIDKDKSPGSSDGSFKKGLPGYTFHKAPGELWRSRFDTATSLIIINNGHADFIYASKAKSRKPSGFYLFLR